VGSRGLVDSQPSSDGMIEQLQSKCSACCSPGYGAVRSSEKAEVRKEDAKKKKPEDNGPFKMKRTVRIHRDRVHAVALSENEFATASWDYTVKLYNLQVERVVQSFGKPRCRWTADQSDAHSTVSKDSAWFPTFRSHPKVDPKKEEEEHRKHPTMHGLYSVALSEIPDLQDRMACAAGKGSEKHGSIHIWDTHTGNRLQQIDGHDEDVNCVEFHSKQKVLVSGSDDCTAKIWDLQHTGGTELRTLKDHVQGVYGTCFLGGSMDYCVATCSFDTLCRVFDMRQQELVQKLDFHTQAVIGIAFSESTHLLASGGDDGQIALYDIKTWRRKDTIDTNKVHGDNEVKRLAIDHSGTMLAAPCSTGHVLVYDISHPQAKLVATLDGHDDCVFGVAWGVEHESGRRVLVSASHDWTSRVWVEKDKRDHHQDHGHHDHQPH